MQARVESIDHAADVGIEVRAPDAATLFEGAAVGLSGLLHGEDAMATVGSSSAPAGAVALACDAVDFPALLVSWLRELLHVLSVRRVRVGRVHFERLDGTTLRARVELVEAAREPIREIKGVTYHGLVAECTAEGCRARVIFDV